jgi:hypothetical protein
MLSFLITHPLAGLAIWFAAGMVIGSIVGCVISGRSIWSVFERAHHEDQGTNWRGLDAAE